MSNSVIDWYDARIADMLSSPDGPVGRMIAGLSAQAAAAARALAPVRTIPGTRRTRAGRGSTARPPGFTKADIRVHGPVVGSRGGLYGGVNVSADPAIFLEYPARQMEHSYPFMSTALDTLNLDF